MAGEPPSYVGEADPFIDAGVRLIGVMDRATNAELIAPVIIDEILIRLLGGHGSPDRADGVDRLELPSHAKAVAWLRENFDQSADVEELARLVNMSLSTFHRQFRAVTSMTRWSSRKRSGCRKRGA